MGLDVTEEEILAVMNFLPEREIYKVLNIESFVTRAAIHGSYTLGPENLSTCNGTHISQHAFRCMRRATAIQRNGQAMFALQMNKLQSSWELGAQQEHQAATVWSVCFYQERVAQLLGHDDF